MDYNFNDIPEADVPDPSPDDRCLNCQEPFSDDSTRETWEHLGDTDEAFQFVGWVHSYCADAYEAKLRSLQTDETVQEKGACQET